MPVTETSHHLPRHGRITVTEDVRATGAVAYQVTGADLHGTVVFKPDVLDDQPVPDRVVIQLGDGEHLLATHLNDLPAIDGITLIGGGADIDLDDSSWRHRLRPAPLCPAGRADPATQAAIRRVVAVCALLAGRYRSLDQVALMHAAARHTAGARLRRLVHQRILPSLRLLAETRDDLAAACTLADALQQLSPLPLLPGPPTDPGRLPCVDPQTYVSADDDGDWLTCPRCQQPTVMIAPGDSLAGLLSTHAQHVCQPARG